MRWAKRQMLPIIVLFFIVILFGFIAGYKLLPLGRIAVLYSFGEQLLDSALPFQSAVVVNSPTANNFQLEELLLHAGLPVLGGQRLSNVNNQVAEILPLDLDLAVSLENAEETTQPTLATSQIMPAQAILTNLSEPLIAIYCSHSSEEYSDGLRIYGQRGGVHIVAERLATYLNGLGLPTIYVDTIHDAPDWSMSYVNSLRTIEQLQAQYPSLRVFIDVHRDSPSESTLVTVDGNIARILFVVGSDQRLPHPNWQQNLAFARQVEMALEERQNNISRGVRVLAGRFNQHVAPQAMLVEIGSTLNTTAEALKAAYFLAQALYDVLGQQV